MCFMGIFQSYAQNYDPIDNRIKSLPKKEYVSLEALYKDIVLPQYSSTDRVRAISMWIIYNIAYDVTYTHSKTPFETLKRRKGVCQSYAEFFKALCDIAQIECHIIVGYGKNHNSLIGKPVRSNHAWNTVKINNKYYLFDLTWASGYVDGNSFTQNYNSRYFMASPEDFILNHLPDDNKWQLLDKPVSENEFVAYPFFGNGFYNFKIKNLSPMQGIIISDTVKISFQSEKDIADATLFRYGITEYGSASGENMQIKRIGKNYELTYVERRLGAYRYCIYLNDDHTFNYKVISPKYKPDTPSHWEFDFKNPHSLIQAYYYVFYKLDNNLFKMLNPNIDLSDLKTIPLAQELNNSLTPWYGDYEAFYIHGPGNIVTFNIGEYAVVLQDSEIGWAFKEIRQK